MTRPPDPTKPPRRSATERTLMIWLDIPLEGSERVPEWAAAFLKGVLADGLDLVAAGEIIRELKPLARLPNEDLAWAPSALEVVRVILRDGTRGTCAFHVANIALDPERRAVCSTAYALARVDQGAPAEDQARERALFPLMWRYLGMETTDDDAG